MAEQVGIYGKTWISTSFDTGFPSAATPTGHTAWKRGTLVNIPSRVDREYERNRTLIDEQRLL